MRVVGQGPSNNNWLEKLSTSVYPMVLWNTRKCISQIQTTTNTILDTLFRYFGFVYWVGMKVVLHFIGNGLIQIIMSYAEL